MSTPANIPQQPTAQELADWLHQRASCLLTVEQGETNDVLAVRCASLGRPEDQAGRMSVLSGAKHHLLSAECPWPLAVDYADATGAVLTDPSPGEAAALVLSPITAEEAVRQRTEREEAQQRRLAQVPGVAERRAAAARQQEGVRLRTDRQREWCERYDTGHQLCAVDPAVLPAIAHSHGPDDDPDHAEPWRFQGYGPALDFHSTRPRAGTGLWTTPVVAEDADGRVLATALSAYWDREFGVSDVSLSEHQRIIPAPGARILRVDSMADLIAMVLAYPVDSEDIADEEYRYPHWYKVSQDWDAIYLTENGAAEVVPGLDDDEEEWEGAYLRGWLTPTVYWVNPAYTVA